MNLGAALLDNEYVLTVVRLVLAMAAGSLIGLERTYHGRPAGFRTHTLVCTASSLLMLLTVFSGRLTTDIPIETLRIDPTRMAQGLMTGIGFLGAGVIFREGLTVRGLTTAASIWITAAIGIMIGMGMFFSAGIAEVIVLGTLAVLRWIEGRIPTLQYGRLRVQFHPDRHVTESELRAIVTSHGITCTTPSYSLESHMVEYEMTVRTQDSANFSTLAEALGEMDAVHGFSLIPTVT